MCIGFLYTLVVSVPSSSVVASVSKNSTELSGCVFYCKLYNTNYVIMCCREFSLCSIHCITNASSINLFPSLGGFCTVLRAFSLKYFM